MARKLRGMCESVGRPSTFSHPQVWGNEKVLINENKEQQITKGRLEKSHKEY